jgi:o-succinylbenzoate---CoA ligase
VVGTSSSAPTTVRRVSLLRLSGVAEHDIDAVEAWLEADDPGPAIVETSGSSGTPKQVVLSRDALLTSATASAARLGGAGPWLLALPSSYVAGLNVVVRSLVAGHRPVVLGERSAYDAALVGAYLSLVPTQLYRWLDSSDDRNALARFAAVLVGGGPVDAALKDRARNAGIRLVATYGMAETCGGCVYDGLPLDAVGLALATDARVRLSGPTLFDGYLDDPAATSEVLVDGWFHTSDAGRLDEDGRLQVLGRLDDMVVSGGVNVPAAAVAARLREHPRVQAAEVLGLADPEWGHRVVAVVIGDLAVDEARAWVGEKHPRSWAPREVVVVPALPMLANGKIDRLAVRDLAAKSR